MCVYVCMRVWVCIYVLYMNMSCCIVYSCAHVGVFVHVLGPPFSVCVRTGGLLRLRHDLMGVASVGLAIQWRQYGGGLWRRPYEGRGVGFEPSLSLFFLMGSVWVRGDEVLVS